jgi:Tol biopolymer transport system component
MMIRPMLALRTMGMLAATSALFSACDDDEPTADPRELDGVVHGLADAERDALLPLDARIPVIPELDASDPADAQVRDIGVADSQPDMRVPPDIRLRQLTMGIDGNEVNNMSSFPVIAGNGRIVAFTSRASNLVPNDNGGRLDVFVWNHETGAIERVSVGHDGAEANADSGNTLTNTVAINHSGSVISFQSSASNLVEIELSGGINVYIRDLDNNRTELINVAPDGSAGNASTCNGVFTSVSADGQFVAFTSHATNLVPVNNEFFCNLYVRNRDSGETEVIAPANNEIMAGASNLYPSISADAHFVVFDSDIPLVANDQNDAGDIYLFDRMEARFTRISVNSNGEDSDQGGVFPQISRDGNYVVFISGSTNLVDDDIDKGGVFVRSIRDAQTERVNISTEGEIADGEWSGNRPRINGNGRFVAFSSQASNLDGPEDRNTKIFVRDRIARRTTFIAYGHQPDISEKGDVVAFVCENNNICIAEIGALFE